MAQDKISNFIQYGNDQRNDECCEKVVEETFTEIEHSCDHESKERNTTQIGCKKTYF